MSVLMEQGESGHQRKTTLFARSHQEIVQRQHSLEALLTDQLCGSSSVNSPPVDINYKTMT